MRDDPEAPRWYRSPEWSKSSKVWLRWYYAVLQWLEDHNGLPSSNPWTPTILGRVDVGLYEFEELTEEIIDLMADKVRLDPTIIWDVYCDVTDYDKPLSVADLFNIENPPLVPPYYDVSSKDEDVTQNS